MSVHNRILFELKWMLLGYFYRAVNIDTCFKKLDFWKGLILWGAFCASVTVRSDLLDD